MLELLAEVEGTPGGCRSWDNPPREVGQLWLWGGPRLALHRGRSKELVGPRGKPREGLGILGQEDGVEATTPGHSPSWRPAHCSVCSWLCDTWPLHTSRVQAVFHLPASVPIYVRKRLTRGQV